MTHTQDVELTWAAAGFFAVGVHKFHVSVAQANPRPKLTARKAVVVLRQTPIAYAEAQSCCSEQPHES